MLRFKLLIHFRLILLIMLGLVLGSVVGGLYYINQTGINDQWRDNIALELENLGVVADFDSLRYEPSRGLVANGVRIYADSSRKEITARLKHLVIDVDKTKLMRGKIRVNNVALSKAEITFPIDPNDPDGPRVIINDLQGNLFLPNKNTIEASEVEGMVAGIKLTLDAHLWSQNLKSPKKATQSQQDERIIRIKIIAKIIEELTHWSWPQNHPPELKLYLEGNMDSPDSAHIEFSLSATELERDDVTLHNIFVKGDYNNKLVTLDQITVEDDSGKLSARADFQQQTRKGRFEITKSTLHLQRLARKLLGVRPLHQITFSTSPSISCTGTIHLDEEFKPDLQLTGKANIKNFSYLGTRFQSLSTDISLRGANVFFSDLQANHAQGSIKGDVMLKDGLIRYKTESTLPVSAYQAFIISDRAKRELSHATFSPSSMIYVKSQGSIQQGSQKTWAFGECRLKNFSYKGVPMKEAKADCHISAQKSDFHNIELTFDYNKYHLREKHGGPSSARVDCDHVSIDHEKRMVHIDNVRTTAWPAPVVRLFVSHVADHCELYRFLRPPNLIANGSFDLNKDQARTDFKIDVRVPSTTLYDFLGETLTLERLRGKVRIRQALVDVTDLSFYTFQGPCNGNISVQTKKRQYTGALHWSRLHLKDLGLVYGFKNCEQGLITGRIDFNGQNSDIRKFNGTGAIALERGNLFSIPMLGPLSPLVGAVLGKKNPTNEPAENASCTYAIRDGIVYSDNFLANTRSLRFTGEGKMNLHKKEIDLMVRMNARGLFSLFALPLKPFMGLFQFAGSGAISDPKWKTSIFTAPKRGKKDPIFRRPPKARVINE